MKFDYSTIIGRDTNLFSWHCDQVLRNGAAGLDRGDWNFNVYIYYNNTILKETTDELIDICLSNDINYELHYESPSDHFLLRLYKAWNRVQQMGRAPLTIRGGSDQAFYPGSFKTAIEHYEKLGECVVNFQTVESPVAGDSRHYVRDFGSNHEEFNETAFLGFCEEIKEPCALSIGEAMARWGGKPGAFSSSLGYPHYRGDGCSFLMSKELFGRIGPMPPLERGYTGDVILLDRAELAGIPSYIAGDAITYHFVAGESRDR